MSSRSHDRQRRIRRNETDTLQLEILLQLKSKESIKKLHDILVTGSKEEPVEESDFFALRHKITSIHKNDTIIIELVKEILAEKETETSLLSQVTPVQNNISSHSQDDHDWRQDTNTTASTQQHQPLVDDQVFDPDDPSDLDSMIMEHNVDDDTSNHLSPSQGHQHNANKSGLNKDAPEWHEGIGQFHYIPNGKKNHLPSITEDDEDPDSEIMNLPQASSTPSISSPLTQASTTGSPPVNNMNNCDAHTPYTTCAEATTSSLTEFSGSAPVQPSTQIISNPIYPMGITSDQLIMATHAVASRMIDQQQSMFTIQSSVPLMSVLNTSSVPLVSNNMLPSTNMVQSQLPPVFTSNALPLQSNVSFQTVTTNPNFTPTSYQPQLQSTSNILATSVPLQYQPLFTPTPTPTYTSIPNQSQFQSTPTAIPTYISNPNQSQFQSNPNLTSLPSNPSTATSGYAPPPQFEPQFQHISTTQQSVNCVSNVTIANPVNTLNPVTSVQSITSEQVSTNNHPTQQMQSMELLQNAFNSNDNNNNNTYLKPTPMEHKNDDQEQYIQASKELAPRQWTSAQPRKFQAKFNNHAKGNFYISKDMIKGMANKAHEEFNTDDINDERLAFGYFKESVAMSINDEQIDNIFRGPDGQSVIIINIDLTFKGSQRNMYLIAKENDLEFRQKVRWRIVDFMSATQICNNLGISNNYLPQSSRSMRWFINGMSNIPIKFGEFDIKKILRNTHFKSLPAKESKRDYQYSSKSHIYEHDLAYYVEQSLSNDKYPIIPVVVIKGKNQWIEWKRIVCIFDSSDTRQYVAISLRFHESNKQWKIECMDYDAGRVYYQHRLVSLSSDNPYSYSFQQISNNITTRLNISISQSQYYGNY